MAITYHQLGNDATANNNFTLRSNGDGSLSLGKGTAASFTELWKINADGTITHDADALATQAEMEAATDLTKIVTPGRAHFHPGFCKMWASYSGIEAEAIAESYNADPTLSDNALGDHSVLITNDMNTATYMALAISQVTTTSGKRAYDPIISARATSSIRINTLTDAGASEDHGFVNVAIFGDLP